MDLRVGLLAVASLCAGCASLNFYSSEDMTGPQVGLKAYYAKPYVLVARDGSSKVTSVAIQYLPDLEHPVYAKASSGLGSANLTLAFSNGMITNFGQVTDTKIPESVTAFGGLQTAIASALKIREETRKLQNQSGDVGKYVAPVKRVAQDLRRLSSEFRQGLSEDGQKTLLLSSIDLAGENPDAKLDGIAAALAAPGAQAKAELLARDLAQVSKRMGSAVTQLDQRSSQSKAFSERVAGLQGELQKVADSLQAMQPESAAEPPALSLYEVIMQGGVTWLREVQLDGQPR